MLNYSKDLRTSIRAAPHAARRAVVRLAMLGLPMAVPAFADTPMTAGVLMQNMPARERYAFAAGVVDGLAYARFQKDNKQSEGMQCIYDWFYKGTGQTMLRIEQAFENFPDYPPGSVIAVMAKKECGE